MVKFTLFIVRVLMTALWMLNYSFVHRAIYE